MLKIPHMCRARSRLGKLIGLPVLMLATIMACSPDSSGVTHDSQALRIAVATNFRPAFEALTDLFNQKTRPVSISANYGSTGSLYAQISNGASYDIFLSADSLRAQKIRSQQPGDAEIFTYAFGQLVLWAPGVNNPNFTWLSHYQGKIAIANPDLAPYGHAARACLDDSGVLSDYHQLILGSSVAQAFHFVASGAARTGIVAKSQVLDYSVGSQNFWLLPQDCYPPIEQQAVALSTSSPAKRMQVNIFMNFLKSAQAQSLIEDAGYLPGQTGA